MNNWNKDTWIGMAVLAVVAVLIIWYVASHPAPAQAPAVPGTPAGAATDKTVEEHEQYYDVSATYPGTTPLASLGGNADVTAVAHMRAWIDETVTQFKKDSGVTTLTPEDVQLQNLGGSRKYALGISYTDAHSPRTVSYVFQVFEDTLGAHPNGFYKTFTFDTVIGADIYLQDLFVPGAPYLKTLSDIAKADLPATIAAAEQVQVSEVDTSPNGMLMSGLVPTEENFSNWVVDGTDLVIIFEPYQIGPWALGTQVDRIPLSKLAGILKPEYQPAQ